MTVKIMIVDDHQLFREGIKRILELEDSFEVVAEAENGKKYCCESTRIST